MSKNCYCCHKEITIIPKDTEYIFCKPCGKKIFRQVHKLRRKEYPFKPWKWGITCPYEIDNIVEKIQKGE